MTTISLEDQLSNPFGPEAVASACFEILCKAMRVDIHHCQVVQPFIPPDLQVGDEVLISLHYRVTDASSGVGTMDEVGSIELPVCLMGESESSAQYFHIPRRVIRFDFVGERLAVCWSEPSENGTRVWYSSSDDMITTHWTTCTCLDESAPTEVPMSFVDGNLITALHPESIPS